MGSSPESVVALMVGKIEIVGIVLSNSTDRIAEIAIPANEVDGISEVVSVSSPPASGALVLIPGFVHGLCIAISRGRSRAW